MRKDYRTPTQQLSTAHKGSGVEGTIHQGVRVRIYYQHCFAAVRTSYLKPLDMAQVAEGAYAVLRRNHAVILTAAVLASMLMVRVVGIYALRSHRLLPNPPSFLG